MRSRLLHYLAKRCTVRGMPSDLNVPPRWLLDEVGLVDGEFSENRTAIVGRPNAQNSAVLNVGHGPPATVTVYLRKRDDWEANRKRLVNEGF
jgi:hypothetical protein